MPVKCTCVNPDLIGKPIDFMVQKGGDKVQATDYRIECRACEKFHSYMTKQTFEMVDIPVYPEGR